MLFDLRSRGRRRTVQVIYIGLAVLIGAGLILFGVGTGTGGGGLFGAFTGGGSSTGAGSVNSAAAKKAQANANTHPSDPASWSRLVQARWSAANSTLDASGSYSTAGKQQLAQLAQAWTHYEKLAKTPNTTTATLAAKAYSKLSQYSSASSAWQAVLTSEPNSRSALQCTAVMSYAENRYIASLGKKVPKATIKRVKAQIESVKTNTSLASSLC
jgi:tetratricopeptide (TPR) repeat protein